MSSWNVFQSKFHRVHADFVGQHVDHLFQRPCRLCGSGPSECSRLTSIDVDFGVLCSDIGTGIGACRPPCRVGPIGIRANRSKIRELKSGEAPIFLCARLQTHHIRWAISGA